MNQKNYLKAIEINEYLEYIVIEVVKYNKKVIRKRIDFNELNVKIQRVLFSEFKLYKLQFFKNKALVFQQIEFKEWNKEKFTEIVHYIKELKEKNRQKIQ